MLSSPDVLKIISSGLCPFCKREIKLNYTHFDFHTCLKYEKPCMRIWHRENWDFGFRVWFYNGDINSIRLLRSNSNLQINILGKDALYIPQFDVFQLSYQELHDKIKKLMVFL